MWANEAKVINIESAEKYPKSSVQFLDWKPFIFLILLYFLPLSPANILACYSRSFKCCLLNYHLLSYKRWKEIPEINIQFLQYLQNACKGWKYVLNSYRNIFIE